VPGSHPAFVGLGQTGKPDEDQPNGAIDEHGQTFDAGGLPGEDHGQEDLGQGHTHDEETEHEQELIHRCPTSNRESISRTQLIDPS
jgi:hypothetical protein